MGTFSVALYHITVAQPRLLEVKNGENNYNYGVVC